MEDVAHNAIQIVAHVQLYTLATAWWTEDVFPLVIRDARFVSENRLKLRVPEQPPRLECLPEWRARVGHDDALWEHYRQVDTQRCDLDRLHPILTCLRTRYVRADGRSPSPIVRITKGNMSMKGTLSLNNDSPVRYSV